ncbi:Fluconazole resistance protein 1 [Recurvomyces mirabilis]|nr:Fluconazole resistance protein 1 [Recurvomyces mirabilis]
MSPAPVSPMAKMGQPIRSISQDSTDAIRKRVCTACDRCRLKKSKCDGTSPCTRCRADNAICVLGVRKKSHDKVYPKGYVEMLEQQQNQLVSALNIMYQRLQAVQAWPGATLPETNGHPLTHDMLAALDLLEMKQDGSGEVETFEGDCDKLQAKLVAHGAGFVQRRGSISSDSDHSQQDRPHLQGDSRPGKRSVFRESFAFNSTSSTPLIRSPAPRSNLSFPPTQPSPLQQSSPICNDPQFYQAEWAIPDLSNPESILRSHFATHFPDAKQTMPEARNMMDSESCNPSYLEYDNTFDLVSGMSYQQKLTSGYTSDMPGMTDFATVMDPIDLDITSFIQVTT